MKFDVYSMGFSNRTWEETIAILSGYKIGRLADIRTLPGSRHTPQFNLEHLQVALPRAGIEYVHLKALGGLRKPRKDSALNAAWRNDAFRGYADYMQTQEFEAARKELIRLLQEKTTVYCCTDAVVLTHAHIDHTGYLPRLVAHGYKGPVFATSATVDLVRILLPDAGHLQEEEANYRNKHHLTKHKPALPLYNVSDAMSSVHVIDSFSAHGDYREILRWLAGFKRAARTTFLVHGEPVAAAAMKDHIVVSHKGWGVEIPAYRQTFEIN